MKKKLYIAIVCLGTAALMFGACANTNEDTSALSLESNQQDETMRSNPDIAKISTDMLTEEEFYTLSESAQDVFADILLGGITLDESQSVEHDGRSYYLVNDSRFHTTELFYQYLNQYFTTDFIEEEILTEENIIFHQMDNGNLYMLSGGRGTNIYYTGHSIEMDKESSQEIVLKATAYYRNGDGPYFDIFLTSEPENLSAYTTQTYTLRLLLEDGAWKFDTFQLFY